MLSGCFHFRVFEFFVSSLFLLVFFGFCKYWLSALYNHKADSQEEDNDIKFTGNYAIGGVLQQPPPYSAYLVVSEDRL